MRIGITGPSGTGKSRLASYIAEKYNIKYITSKETRKFDKETEDRWFEEFGYKYSDDRGHSGLIQIQNQFPKFGLEWQRGVLDIRNDMYSNINNFVCDRTQFDSLVYMTTQVMNYADKNYIENFYKSAVDGLNKSFDLIIYLTTEEMQEVEDNKLRVSNIEYQRYIDQIFSYYINRFVLDLKPTIITMSTRDFDKKTRTIDEILISIK